MQTSSVLQHQVLATRKETEALGSKELKALARRLTAAKLELWTILLSDRGTIEQALSFILEAARRRTKERARRAELDDSGVAGFLEALSDVRKSPLKGNRLKLEDARATLVAAISEYDPCMDIGITLISQAKSWGLKKTGCRQIAYAKHLQRVSQSWGRYSALRNTFISRNMRLVTKVTRRIAVRFQVPHEDLVQEGAFALNRAAGMYDPDYGYAFSTYATNWIRAWCVRHCRSLERTVSIPGGTQEKLEKCRAAARKLSGSGLETNVEALAEATGLSEKVVIQVSRFSIGECYSMEKTVCGKSLGGLLTDSMDVESELSASYDSHTVSNALYLIPHRQQMILRSRFGLGGAIARTLQEIATDLGLSRERVRQLEAKALKTLRNALETRRRRVYAGL